MITLLPVLALLAAVERPVVMEGTVALGAGQPEVHVQVIMVAGRTSNTGCSGGVLHTGRFVVSVTPPTGAPVESDLNALLGAEELAVPAHSNFGVWPINFADFNRDGSPDFSFASHFCGNNGSYYLLSVAPSGRVTRLAVVPDAPLIVFDEGPSSSSIHITPQGIEVGAYNNASGSGVTTAYRWDPGRRVFIRVRPTPSSTP